jgi:site-specific DNA-methyltransferase (adenine-specific)
MPIRTEIIKFCETIGFDYMGAIIWQKVTTTNTTGGATIMGSYPYPRNGILKLDYEFIIVFKKPGQTEKVSNEKKKLSRLTAEEWNTYFTGHWKIPGEKQSSHLATFPSEVPHRLIKMFSFVGDTILDPFLGSGTTSVCAKNLDRNSIGIEINDEFISIIKEKFKKSHSGQSKDYTIAYQQQEKVVNNIEIRISKLPYIFKDPHVFDKITDPQKKDFGSKIKMG